MIKSKNGKLNSFLKGDLIKEYVKMQSNIIQGKFNLNLCNEIWKYRANFKKNFN